jgi:outer membrane protein assembly factor BamB
VQVEPLIDATLFLRYAAVMRFLIACVVAISILRFVPPAAGSWPEFRGPTGDGHALVGSLPLTWSETKNIKWKTPIPHHGWSTPVILDGQIWVTTATKDGHDYFVLSLDADTGEIRRNKHLFHHDHPEPLGNNVNNYAACSPAIEPGRIYVHFGSYGTACLDTSTGETLWSRDDLPCRHYRGPSSSVVLFENLVILTLDGADLQYVVALDKETGDIVWKTDRDVEWNDQNITGEYAKYADFAKEGDFRKAHSTPLVVTALDGRQQLISGGAKAAFGYEPRTGQEIWRVTYNDWSVAPRPLYRDGITYLVTGLMHPELWAIRVDATGNLTETDSILWKVKRSVAKTASPILVDGLIYMVGDEGVLSCTDAATGESVWKKRLKGKYAASPIYADGRLYFCNQDGDTTVIKPGREYEVLATNVLDDGLLASPAADEGALYLRTKTHLYRIEDVKDQQARTR